MAGNQGNEMKGTRPDPQVADPEKDLVSTLGQEGQQGKQQSGSQQSGQQQTQQTQGNKQSGQQDNRQDGNADTQRANR